MATFTSSAEFQKAAETVKKLKQEPKPEELLELYALYKQVTVGDLDPESEGKPSIMNFANRKKWEHREKIIGKPRSEAQEEYITLVKTLVDKYGLKE